MLPAFFQKDSSKQYSSLTTQNSKHCYSTILKNQIQYPIKLKIHEHGFFAYDFKPKKHPKFKDIKLNLKNQNSIIKQES